MLSIFAICICIGSMTIVIRPIIINASLNISIIRSSIIDEIRIVCVGIVAIIDSLTWIISWNYWIDNWVIAWITTISLMGNQRICMRSFTIGISVTIDVWALIFVIVLCSNDSIAFSICIGVRKISFSICIVTSSCIVIKWDDSVVYYIWIIRT